MDHTRSVIRSSLRRSENRLPHIVNFLESDREAIIDTWMTDSMMTEIFQKFRIDSEMFIREFGSPLFDSFVNVIKNESDIGKHSYMVHFFIYLKNQDIEIDSLIQICNRLKWSIITRMMKKDSTDVISSVNTIHYMFDDYSCHILTYFTHTIFHLLEKYKLATDSTNTVVIGDTEDNIVYVNNEACRLSCYSRNELLGYNQNMMTHPDMAEEAMVDILKVVRSKQVWKGVVKNRTKNGDPYWIKTTVIPILDSHGEMMEYISIGTDITDAHTASEELRNSFAKLRDLDEKKDEFINIASHELRTPMTAISGYISMILEGDAGDISDEVRTYLEQVYKSSKQLITLINDMLDIARLESGKWKLYYEDMEMRTCINDVIVNLKPLAILKHQIIESYIDYDEFFYRTDNRKFQQVLINIIGNALKYTPAYGRITVRSWVDHMVLYIRVEDTGMGIPKQHLRKIFEKFSQVKNTLTRDINGTGLGLAITKTIVEKFFGTIEVESSEGEGSIFTIRLPLPKD